MTTPHPNPYPAAHIIKEIGRGKKGARSMSREDARELYAAILDGRVSDLELGGILLAMRIKGESVEEIAGFLDAAEASFAPLHAPAGACAPVIIPSYNGARKMANLTALLALLLAREGVPVLVHGVAHDPGRVATAEVLAALGIAPANTHAEAEALLAAGKPAFITIDALAPKLAYMLSLRRVLGVRNSTHTLVKTAAGVLHAPGIPGDAGRILHDRSRPGARRRFPDARYGRRDGGQCQQGAKDRLVPPPSTHGAGGKSAGSGRGCGAARR
jgi:anthranilate phosphoribosyltransferase